MPLKITGRFGAGLPVPPKAIRRLTLTRHKGVLASCSSPRHGLVHSRDGVWFMGSGRGGPGYLGPRAGPSTGQMHTSGDWEEVPSALI